MNTGCMLYILYPPHLVLKGHTSAHFQTSLCPFILLPLSLGRMSSLNQNIEFSVERSASFCSIALIFYTCPISCGEMSIVDLGDSSAMRTKQGQAGVLGHRNIEQTAWACTFASQGWEHQRLKSSSIRNPVWIHLAFIVHSVFREDFRLKEREGGRRKREKVRGKKPWLVWFQ